MSHSVRFIRLRARVNELRIRFLPRTFSPSGMYTHSQLDKARAYRMLVHAEIEHFFEERALEIATLAFDLLRTQYKPSRPLIHLLANIEGKQEGLPTKLGTPTSPLSIAGKVLHQYKHKITDNNGIRISNILRILLPIGVQENEIDPAWLLTTDGFGMKRGAAAHSASITYTIDPQDDFHVVTQIMDGVGDLDVLLNKIKKAIR